MGKWPGGWCVLTHQLSASLGSPSLCRPRGDIGSRVHSFAANIRVVISELTEVQRCWAKKLYGLKSLGADPFSEVVVTIRSHDLSFMCAPPQNMLSYYSS